jgi:heme/copper-type cytochrome/quinol oxidase subunit 2
MGNMKWGGIKGVVVVVVIVIIIAIVGVVLYRDKVNRMANTTLVANVPAPATGMIATNSSAPTSSTRAAVPLAATVPDKGATDTPSNVAVPSVEGIGDPSGNVSYRSFNINIRNNAFSPDTVVVNQGDTINLEITAVDANYSFTQPDYGFNILIGKGEKKTVQFQALQSGDFTFYCASCGGPSQGPVGHIIIVASK